MWVFYGTNNSDSDKKVSDLTAAPKQPRTPNSPIFLACRRQFQSTAETSRRAATAAVEASAVAREADAVDAGGDRKQMPPCDNGGMCRPLATAAAAAGGAPNPKLIKENATVSPNQRRVYGDENRELLLPRLQMALLDF